MTTEMQRRMLYMPVFHIDTNLINARGKLEAMNQIERWAEEKLILVNMSGVSFKEAQAGGDLARTKKALSQINRREHKYQRSVVPEKIEAALLPEGAKTDNERNDVKIVYDAAHYAAILVTRDGDSKTQPGGILGNRDKLRVVVKILSDSEAVEFIRTKIAERDDFNRRVNGNSVLIFQSGKATIDHGAQPGAPLNFDGEHHVQNQGKLKWKRLICCPY